MKKLLIITLTSILLSAIASAQTVSEPSVIKTTTGEIPSSCDSADRNQIFIYKKDVGLYQCKTGIYEIVNGSSVVLLSQFNKLNDAVAAAAAGQKKIVLIDKNAVLTTDTVIPGDIILSQTNGAKITKTGNAGKITFQGIGLENPLAEKLFSGFAPGDIVWTGIDYPREISAELFDSNSVTEKYNIADRALLAKSAIIHVFKGSITGQSVVSDKHTLKFGAGTFLNTAAVDYQFVMQSNTKLLGEGAGITNVSESSADGIIRIVYSSGVTAFPFKGKNYNIEIRGIRFYSDVDKLVDTSASAVSLGNTTNAIIADNEFDGTHGFGAYVGGFADADNTGKPNYAENCRIERNVFKNLGAQNAGVIQGKNIFITDNIFTNIGQQRLIVRDGTADGKTTVTSAKGGFTQNMVGAAATILKPNVFGATYNITAVTPKSITLNAAVPAGTDLIIQVRTPFLSVIDLEPNHPNDILENVVVARNIIDGRNAVHTANGIVSQRGGATASRNIQIKDNLIIGGDNPNNFVNDSPRNFSIGIVLEGADASDVSGNTITGTSQSAISVANSTNSNISNNKVLRGGGGGNPGIQVIGSRNNVFNQNIISIIGTGSQSDYYQESEYSGVINVAASDGAKSAVKFVSGQYFIPGNIGGRIRFDGASYVITDFIDLNNVRIARTGGALSSQNYVSEYNKNTYKGTPPGKILLSANSFSTIVNEMPFQSLAKSLPNSVTTIGNTAGNLTTFHSYTITSENALLTDGDALEFLYSGKFSKSASTNKRIVFDISGGVDFDSGNISSNGDWILKASYTRNADGNEKIVTVELNITGQPPIIKVFNYAAPDIYERTISLKASGTLANDVILKSALVRRRNW